MSATVKRATLTPEALGGFGGRSMDALKRLLKARATATRHVACIVHEDGGDAALELLIKSELLTLREIAVTAFGSTCCAPSRWKFSRSAQRF